MFGAQVKGIRGADSQVKSLKDVGEYDVWSHVIISNCQQGELMAFSYAVGGQVSGACGQNCSNATKLDTNMRVANQFVDESMSVYAIAIQIERRTRRIFQDPVVLEGQEQADRYPYQTTYQDFKEIEMCTLFRMHVGGDKPFAEGLVTWFAEAGGFYGMTNDTAECVISNNVPTPASARRWEFKLPIGRIEKFWAEFSWPGGCPEIEAFPGQVVVPPALPVRGKVGAFVRLLGVRARGVQ